MTRPYDTRGNTRQNIYLEDEDRVKFIDTFHPQDPEISGLGFRKKQACNNNPLSLFERIQLAEEIVFSSSSVITSEFFTVRTSSRAKKKHDLHVPGGTV